VQVAHGELAISTGLAALGSDTHLLPQHVPQVQESLQAPCSGAEDGGWRRRGVVRCVVVTLGFSLQSSRGFSDAPTETLESSFHTEE